jgi:spermidine/putrescine transport system permease protein
MTTAMNRREFLKATAMTGGALAAAGVGGSPRPAAAAGTVNWLAWGGHVEPQGIKSFFDASGIRVNHVGMSGNAETFAKLKLSGASQYDLFEADGLWPVRYHQEGMIEPIQLDSIPNVAKNMYPEFKKIPALQVSGGAMLMVPWGWNPTVLVYNKNKIKTPPTSYEVLLDKQYKGHVGFSDQHEFLWPVAAYLLGYDPFKMNKEQLGRAKDVLIQIKRNAPHHRQGLERAAPALRRGDGVDRAVEPGPRADHPVLRRAPHGLGAAEGRLRRLDRRRHAGQGLAEPRRGARVAQPHPQPGVRGHELQAPAARLGQPGRGRAPEGAGHERDGAREPDGPARDGAQDAAHRGAREPGRVRAAWNEVPRGFVSRRLEKVAARSDRGLLWGLLPVAVVQVGLFVVPMAIMFLYSFWTTKNFQIVPTFTLDNYRAFFESWTYPRVLLRTLGTAVVITAATLVLAYPLAYFIVRYTRRWQKVLLAAVILSFWTSGLLRAYAWMAVLGHGGIINKGLRALGLIDAAAAVSALQPVLGRARHDVLFLPFAVVAIYASLEKMDWALLHAAGDLGARPLRAFWHVTLPQTMPGVVSAAALTFVPLVGMFFVPLLVGGPTSVMIAPLIANQMQAFQLGLGAAMSFIVALIVMAALALPWRYLDLNRLER